MTTTAPWHPANPRTTADRLAALLHLFLGAPLPFRIRAWDGSENGPDLAPTVLLNSRTALHRILWNPRELGMAEAYITGELDIDGDLGDGLARVWQALTDRGRLPAPTLRERARVTVAAVRLGALGLRPTPPNGRAHLTGRLHTRARDRAAIGHHYDLSNDFYALLLDPTMAYSCAYWTSEHPDYTLADAQQDKLDLICRKLRLTEDSRLLDVGCGWGSLALHAAQNHRARVTAVTLSARQHAHTTARAAELGLTDHVDVRLCDYREIDTDGYDAVSTVEMGEHVGADQYPAFTRTLRNRLRPGGRLLVQQMSRRHNAPGGGPFIATYIAPDMHMRPLGATLSLIEDAGMEVLHVESMRDHYARTCIAWVDTLERRLPEFHALVGEQTARTWRLYLTGAALAFRQHRMGVDQILAVNPEKTY
ncbi:cyclopropane-fatty-acyl-phospholipid synthase family protein [Streptomyces sp. NPDC051577]|uniref:cyclopropane-fatty-acyl-phospholipid synthase family protein n=1 Tax=Streptomyces sp. NPDC051577 TaxID=3155166 RepID=UPI003430C845